MNKEKELNFNEAMAEHQKNVTAVKENIAKAKRVLTAGEYKLARLMEEEIALYKKHGMKVPQELANPELTKLKETALLGKKIISEKIEETVDFFNEKGIDREFFKAKYQDYKTMCIDKGIKVKSSEEVQKLLSSVKNFKEEIKEVNLYDIINKVSKEAEDKTSKIRQSLKEYDFASKIDYVVLKFFPPKTDGYSIDDKKKYLLFFQWAQTVEEQLDNPVKEIYPLYEAYIIANCAEEDREGMFFKVKNNEFADAINQYKNIEVKINNDEPLGV